MKQKSVLNFSEIAKIALNTDIGDHFSIVTYIKLFTVNNSYVIKILWNSMVKQLFFFHLIKIVRRNKFKYLIYIVSAFSANKQSIENAIVISKW